MQISDYWKKYHRISYRKFVRFIGNSEDETTRNLFRLFQVALYSSATILFLNIFSFFDTNRGFGAFGDFFGGMLNPILTFLMFMGVLITIILQQKELKLTRIELSNSSSALAEQAQTQDKQRFENTFFSLLEQHNEMLAELNRVPNEKTRSKISNVHRQCFQSRVVTLAESKTTLENYNHVLGHYFRTLYQLLKLIATKHPGTQIGMDCSIECLTEKKVSVEEKFYANLVRAVLSHEVTQLLAINCYSSDDLYLKFKLLICRYEFLEHMPLGAGNTQIVPLLEAIDFFGSEAFGNSQFLANVSNN